MRGLYLNTVSDNLAEVLNQLMRMEELNSFRLVGGTALSLQLGHRLSVDIDLFTDKLYGSVDFESIEKGLENSFPFVDMLYKGNVGFGKSYQVGSSEKASVKLDLFYTDDFIRPIIEIDAIRMATIEEIAAMKMEVIGNNGRKKDFWDVHELLDYLSLEQMFVLYAERYPYSHSKEDIINKIVDFWFADNDLDPVCLQGKYWELIKSDFIEIVQNL